MKRQRTDHDSPPASEKLARLQETPHHESSPPKECQQSSPSQKTIIYIVEKKIPSGQLSHLRTVARRKDFDLSPSFDGSVTHVVSALQSYERTGAALNTTLPDKVAVVNLKWLTSSFQEGRPLEVTEPYRLNRTCAVTSPENSITAKIEPFKMPEYECQRITRLNHHNLQLSEALEKLECFYQYKEEESRALAFRQASCTIKALPWKVTCVDQVSSLPRIGRHSKQIIQDILDLGYSHEVEECQSSEWFHCMKLFTSVYGCGTATAQKWYHQGLRTIDDVTHCMDLTLTTTQRLGLKYYHDISVPIPRSETVFITETIQRQAEACFPGTHVEAVGGYRRGKPYSHDVDLLLTHHDKAVAECLLHTLLTRLQSQGMVIHADVFAGQNTDKHIQHDHINTSGHTFTPAGKQRKVVFDHLDKAFCIVKLDTKEASEIKEHREDQEGENDSDQFIIRRVDLIVSPPQQYPFAIVSWTGSKQFNRSMRRYSVNECGMSVTAHGIYSMSEGKFLPASTERDVFSILKLEYREPQERNC